MNFGEAALREIGVPEDQAAEIAEQVRRLDAERLELEIASNDTRAGIPLILNNTVAPTPRPTPLTTPRREAQALNEEAAAATRDAAQAPDTTA